MSSTTFTVMRCDRCGFETEIRSEDRKLGWSLIFATDMAASDKPRAIGSAASAFDICPGCAEQLFTWWNQRGDVSQPPPPKPPERRPALSREGRKEAFELANMALREQAIVAINALKEQPTSVLSQDILPGSYYGVDERAAALVASMVTALGGRK